MRTEGDIWYMDPKDFVSLDHLHEFVPLSTMTFEQKLNSIMRFAIYFTLLLMIVQRDAKVIYIVVFVALFTWGMYAFYARDKREFYSKHAEANLKYDKHKKEACSLPTKNNPFANILVSDYVLNPKRKPGCDITKKNMRKKVEKYFNHNLYRDVDDIWNRKSSSRNFYQMPIQTIPNQQGDFAQWLYGRDRTCKQGAGKQCLRNQL
jgi:hypothetical protein